MTEKYQPIPHRLKNMAVGGHVAGTEDIIDDNLNKTQNVINAENNSKFVQLDNEIEGLEKQDVVPVDTLPDVSSADTKKIYRVVGEDSYTDYMVNASGDGWKTLATYSFPGIDDEPTAGSDNLVKSGGVYDSISSLEEEENLRIDGISQVFKNYRWSDGFVADSRINSSSESQFCQPVLFRAGEKLIYKTNSTYGSAVVQVADNTPVSVGSTVNVSQILIDAIVADTQYEYTFEEDMWVICSVLKNSYSLNTYKYSANSINERIENINSILEDNGDIVINSTISSNASIIYNKLNADFGKNIGIVLNEMTCSFSSGSGISVGIYLSDGTSQYRSINKTDNLIKYSTSNDTYITGVYISVVENAVSVSGDVELELLYKSGYVEKVIVPSNTYNIEKIREEIDVKGRYFVRFVLSESNSSQSIKYIEKNFGNKVAIRIVYNDATLVDGSKIRANIYSSAPTKALDIPTDGSWVFWTTSSDINAMYFQTTEGVSRIGALAIEIAYSDYYSFVSNIHEKDFGTITFSTTGTFVTRRFDAPISFEDVSDVELIISNLTYGQEYSHPYIYVYALYNENGTNNKHSIPITDGISRIKVSAYGNDKLYGVMFSSASDFEVSFDVKAQIENTIKSIPALAPYETSINVPSYYSDYIKERQRLIRNFLNDTIINGDAFFFITDTHWEYNAKNSPGIIKRLNEELSIPRLFHGGDVYNDSIQKDGYAVDCINALRTALNSDKVYVTDGNHEFINSVGTYGDVFAESRIFLDDVVYGGINKNYYYVDNKQKKIRYINLYSFGEYVNGSITRGFADTEQLNWFRDVALNVENDWGIFIFTHILSYVNPRDNAVHDSCEEVYDLYRIINGYQGNGKILACITGHTHWDCVVQDRCSCPIICTTSDMNFPFKISYSTGETHYEFDFLFEKRNCGTISEQAFDVVVYDKDNMVLNFVRIGSRAMNLSNSHAEDAQVDIRTILIDSINIGETKTLNSPFTITSWVSSDSNVVSIDSGNITANAAGYAVITGTDANNSKQAWFIKVV